MSPLAATTDTPTIIVTGAARGIGAHTVLELARNGANVTAVDVTDAVEEIAARAGRGVTAQIADVTDLDAVLRVVEMTVAATGRLDGIFNNAGILGASASVVDYPLDVYQRVFDVNVRGVFNGMRAAIPALKATGGGSIVNTASTGALIGATGQAPYVASKHAVLGLTRCAALELAQDGIRVNALCPGATDTAMLAEVFEGWDAGDEAAIQGIIDAVTPTRRMGAPDEMAKVATWLLLEAPPYLTGTPVVVDGAQTAR